MNIRLDGKTALITGASRGLGFAMARTFAEAGAKVALLARGQEGIDAALAEIGTVNGEANNMIKGYACDVTSASAIEETYRAVEGDLGPIDVLVNNAGSSARGPFPEITDEMWQADFDLKVFAAIRLSRLAFPGMAARKSGRIINVLNVGAKAPAAEGAPTAVSRAAGLALTKVLACEGAPHNVLVNSLHVGKIESDQWVRRRDAETPDMPLEAFFAKEGEKLPMKRMGTAQEFANVALFLASDAASYVAGTAINVDGGLSPVT